MDGHREGIGEEFADEAAVALAAEAEHAATDAEVVEQGVGHLCGEQ